MASCAFHIFTTCHLVHCLFPPFFRLCAVFADSGHIAAVFMQKEKPFIHPCVSLIPLCAVHSLLHFLFCPFMPPFIPFLFSGSCEELHRPILSPFIHHSFSRAYLKSIHTCSPSLVRAAWNYLLLNGLQQLTAAQEGFALFIDFYFFCLSVCMCLFVCSRSMYQKIWNPRTFCGFELLKKWPVDWKIGWFDVWRLIGNYWVIRLLCLLLCVYMTSAYVHTPLWLTSTSISY